MGVANRPSAIRSRHAPVCVLFVALGQRADLPLILAANRDEFYDRPATPLHRWPDAPHVLAGRDETGGGTWLGVTEAGRWAALTNVRTGAPQRADAPSRGALVADFLEGDEPAGVYLKRVARRAGDYNPFNLLVGEGERAHFLSALEPAPRDLRPGVYGLSNQTLDSPWPKVTRGAAAFRAEITTPAPPEADRLLAILQDRERAPDALLPDTGVGREMERFLSPLFIASERYGTRASTVVLQRADRSLEVTEQTYSRGGEPGGRVHMVTER